MGSKTARTIDLTLLAVGASAAVKTNGGLYKYSLTGVFGTASVVVLQGKFGADWIPLSDITGTPISNTDTGATSDDWNVYLPNNEVRVVVSVDDLVSGTAYLSPVISHNAA